MAVNGETLDDAIIFKKVLRSILPKFLPLTIMFEHTKYLKILEFDDALQGVVLSFEEGLMGGEVTLDKPLASKANILKKKEVILAPKSRKKSQGVDKQERFLIPLLQKPRSLCL